MNRGARIMDGSAPLLERLVCGQHELEGWRMVCELHPLAYPSLDFQTDLAPAFAYGLFARQAWRDSAWNADLEVELAEEWQAHCGTSRLPWHLARALVRQGFEGFRGARHSLVSTQPMPIKTGLIGQWMHRLARRFALGRHTPAAG